MGQSFQSTLCGNVYARNQFLQAHAKREHNYCEEKFSYEVKRLCDYEKKSSMLEHAITHSGEPVYKCDICQQTSNTKTAFRHHLNMHEGKYV